MPAKSPDSSLVRTACARIPTSFGDFQLCHYANERDYKEHLAIIAGDVTDCERVLVRVHSECFTGDVLGSMRCDCGEQLSRAMALIAEEGCGVIIYLRQEGRGIGLAAKLQAYNLQDQGYDTVDANLVLGHQADEREYWAAAGILDDLGIRSIRLLTNNPDKIERLEELGVHVAERIALMPSVTKENAAYLDAKVRRMRHMLEIAEADAAHASSGLDHESWVRLERLKQLSQSRAAIADRPFVTLSYAQSIDGSIARTPGEPYAISSDESLMLTHALRAAHDAVLVGVGTILADNPRLNVRRIEGPNPAAVILDSHLRTPPSAKVFDCHDKVWIVAGQDAPADAAAMLEERGARLLYVAADDGGRVRLTAALDALGDEQTRSIMIEGGASVTSSCLRERLADYAVITIAPLYLGGLQVLHSDPAPLTSLQMPRLKNSASHQLGRDVLLWGEFDWSDTGDVAARAKVTAFEP